ncbi:MAG TPA: hypothetical protein PLI09_02980 [Candidatus Hydrogenedentes bacterium]|nr:hypothetical protein [Candidatus Hydrogenedentota bacterium]
MRAFSGIWMVCVAACVGLCAGVAHAEWTTQTIELHPGWNAVFLLVQPAENGCEQVFADVPVKSVWSWVKRFSSVQFLQNPDELLPEMPDWLTYFPPSHPQAFLTDLFALHAGKCYLIELDGTEPRTIVLEGKTEIRKIEWIPNSFNLAGFHVNSADPPTFEKYFAGDSALSGQAVYRTLTNGKNEMIGDLAATRLRPGEAYWVYCKGASSFSGPLKVDFDLREGLDYGKDLLEQTLRLKNVSLEERTVTVRLRPSTRPVKSSVKSELPVYGGDVALSFIRLLAWRPLEEPLVFPLAPGIEQDLRLAVRRAAMKKPGLPDAVYESILEVSDDKGSFFEIPVSAKAGGDTAGLWVGNVKVNAISEAGNAADSVTPTPTASEFTFRIIVHVDESGAGRLLQHVTLMQVQAVREPDPDNPGHYIETAPPRYVLLTNDTLISQYEGISMRDGKLVGRRITAPVFGFRDPVSLTGDIGTAFEATLTMPYDDALNPFLHRYHPDHDNKDERYSSTLAEGKESFTFERAIRLEFSAEDPDDIDPPEWGDKLLGGIYRETITGVHKRDLHVQGTFLLTRVVDVALLNDGN